MKVENIDTETSCNHKENNSNEVTNRAINYQASLTSQECSVTLKWLSGTLTDFGNRVGTKISEGLLAILQYYSINLRSFSKNIQYMQPLRDLSEAPLNNCREEL